MALDQTERKIAEFGQANGKTKEQTLFAIGKYRKQRGSTGAKPEQTADEPSSLGGFIGDTVSQQGEALVNAKDRLNEAGKDVVSNFKNPDLSFSEKVVKSGADTFKGIGRFIGGLGFDTAKAIAPQGVEDAVASGAKKIAESDFIQERVKDVEFGLDLLSPEQREGFDNALGYIEGLSEIVGVGKGNQILKQTAGATADLTETGARAVAGKTGELIDTAKVGVQKGVATLEDTALGALDATAGATSRVTAPIGRTVDRIKTNLDVGKQTDALIKSLPGQKAQKAVRDGVEFDDITSILNVVDADKKAIKEFADNAFEFASKNSKATDPAELVGTPIIAKLNEVKAKRTVAGKKLGELSNKLGNFDRAVVTNNVVKSLQETPGLQGIKLVDGKLDFSGTNLASALSKSDQKAIQQAFTEATKNTAGKNIHLYRQELFEILGGKKKSLTNITATQEKAFDSIRRGLADTLGDEYKALTKEFATINQPIRDLEKMLRANGIDDDLLKMKAGTLARRLQSAAPTGVDLKQILRNLDEVSGTRGVSAEKMQEVFNILDKYLNLDKGGTLKGRMESATTDVSLMGSAASKVNELGGITEGVTQKALKEFLEEALSL